jgi:hypothetical protein
MPTAMPIALCTSIVYSTGVTVFVGAETGSTDFSMLRIVYGWNGQFRCDLL